MSIASVWADKMTAAAQAMRETTESTPPPPSFEAGGCTGSVNPKGGLDLALVSNAVVLDPDQALALGQWLLETYT